MSAPLTRSERIRLAARVIATLQAGSELPPDDETPIALFLTLTRPEMKNLGALLMVANACNERASSGPAGVEWELARARLARGASPSDESQADPPPTCPSLTGGTVHSESTRTVGGDCK